MPDRFQMQLGEKQGTLKHSGKSCSGTSGHKNTTRYQSLQSSAKAPHPSWQAPDHIGITGVSRRRHTLAKFLWQARKLHLMWGLVERPTVRKTRCAISCRHQDKGKAGQLNQDLGNEQLDQGLGNGRPDQILANEKEGNSGVSSLAAWQEVGWQLTTSTGSRQWTTSTGPW